jgi:putative FmdB family regulatory protein
MPIYEYKRRSDGSIFEIHQSMKDEPLKKCPTTGDDVERIISASAFHLKGSGWYTTDYKAPSAGSSAAETKNEVVEKPACQAATQPCGAGACEKPSA